MHKGNTFFFLRYIISVNACFFFGPTMQVLVLGFYVSVCEHCTFGYMCILVWKARILIENLLCHWWYASSIRDHRFSEPRSRSRKIYLSHHKPQTATQTHTHTHKQMAGVALHKECKKVVHNNSWAPKESRKRRNEAPRKKRWHHHDNDAVSSSEITFLCFYDVFFF